MLIKAARDWGVDLSGSFIVGDKLVDVEAGFAAGCRPILVRTGYGESVKQSVPIDVPIFDDLLAAARFISGEFTVDY